VKEKTFIFGAYEGVRQSLAGTIPTNVPSLTARQGNLCADPACSTFNAYPIATNGVGRYLTFWPAPKSTDPVCPPSGACSVGAPGDSAVVSSQNNSAATEGFFTTRVDQKFSAKDSIFATYMFDNAKTHATDPLDTWLVSRRQLVVLEEQHILTSNLVNTFRVVFSRDSAIVNSPVGAIFPASKDTTLGIFSTHPQFAPQVFVGGLTNDAGGFGSDPTYHIHWNSYQLYDDAFWSRGRHSLKLGFALERMQDNMLADSQPTGLIQFGSLPAFFNDQPTSAIATIPGNLTERGMRETLVGGYIHDDWHVYPHLTVNLGLRYEITTVPTEVQGKLSNTRLMTSPTNLYGLAVFSQSDLKGLRTPIGGCLGSLRRWQDLGQRWIRDF